MGLMTEPSWDSNPGLPSSTNFHQKNIKQLKAIQERAKQQQQQQQHQSNGPRHRQQPLKAFALPESVPPVSGHAASNVKNKYGPVQPRLYDWTVNGKGPDPLGIPHAELTNGRTSPAASHARSSYAHVQSRVQEWTSTDKPATNFLLGHQKTGPFLTGSAASSVVGGRRGQRSSRVPNMDYQDDVDDSATLHAPPSIGRFSDVTIEERKIRIQNMVADIYAVQPLCKEHLTRTTIERNLRRFASCDEVSEIGSVRAGSMRPEVRGGSTARSLASRQSISTKLTRAGSMISVNNVDPLTSTIRRTEHESRKPPTSKNRPSQPVDTPTHSALRPMVSKSYISPRPTSRDRPPSPTDRTAMSRNSRRSATPTFLPLGDDTQSVIARGVDVDYVNANVESVSTVGHHRRQEVLAAIEAANVKKPSMLPPDNYKSGAVPKYLKNRQIEWKEEEERREREKPDPDCPPNHIRLSDEARLEALSTMRSELDGLLRELSSFSVRSDSIRIRQRKRDIEESMRQLEARIKVYERPKVFVLDRLK